MLHTPHYRDRICETIFRDYPEYATLFGAFEGGHLIAWRWGSLAATARALKRRAAPLRMLWSLDTYLLGAASGEDHAGQVPKSKTETLKTFDHAIKDAYFWHYLVPWRSNLIREHTQRIRGWIYYHGSFGAQGSGTSSFNQLALTRIAHFNCLLCLFILCVIDLTP